MPSVNSHIRAADTTKSTEVIQQKCNKRQCFTLYDGWVGGVAGVGGEGELGQSRDGWKCWLNRGIFVVSV